MTKAECQVHVFPGNQTRRFLRNVTWLMCWLISRCSKLRLHSHNLPYLPFYAHIKPEACSWYGRIITSNLILSFLWIRKWHSCVFQLCLELSAETESVTALNFHHLPLASRWEMLRCRVVHLNIPHTALNTHSPPLAAIHSGAHTQREGCRWNKWLTDTIYFWRL